MPPLHRFSRLGALALACGLILAVVLGGRDWPRYRRLQERGVGTDGWVTGKDLLGRRKVSYSFEAGGRLYSGAGIPGHGNPGFAELSVGDRVIVFYLPKDPEISSLGDPKELLRDQNRAMALALLAFLPVLAWFLSRELRKAAK